MTASTAAAKALALASARERATHRFWMASQRALAGSLPAIRMMELLAELEAEDCQLLRSAAHNTLAALLLRRREALEAVL